jgi:hypothetical protein
MNISDFEIYSNQDSTKFMVKQRYETIWTKALTSWLRCLYGPEVNRIYRWKYISKRKIIDGDHGRVYMFMITTFDTFIEAEDAVYAVIDGPKDPNTTWYKVPRDHWTKS